MPRKQKITEILKEAVVKNSGNFENGVVIRGSGNVTASAAAGVHVEGNNNITVIGDLSALLGDGSPKNSGT